MGGVLAAIPAALGTAGQGLYGISTLIPGIGAPAAAGMAATLPTGGSLYPAIEGELATTAAGGLPNWATPGNLGMGIGGLGTLDQMLQQPGGGAGMAPGQPVQFPPPEMAPSPGANLPSPFMGAGTLPMGLPPEILRLLGMRG